MWQTCLESCQCFVLLINAQGIIQLELNEYNISLDVFNLMITKYRSYVGKKINYLN